MNTQEQWQLTLKAAELYEHYPARYILGPWAPLLVDAARVAAGERVLDVACGTGVVARAAAKRVGATGRVVGVDLNLGMIAVARSLPATNDGPIEWFERSALDLRFENASFDVVLCQQGLQFFQTKRWRCRRCVGCLITAVALRLAFGILKASAFILVPSAQRSINLWATKWPLDSPLLGRLPPLTNCSVSQRKLTFLL
jgi:SAM-dependent methyltransferase